jgi:hypothetical protein
MPASGVSEGTNLSQEVPYCAWQSTILQTVTLCYIRISSDASDGDIDAAGFTGK